MAAGCALGLQRGGSAAAARALDAPMPGLALKLLSDSLSQGSHGSVMRGLRRRGEGSGAATRGHLAAAERLSVRGAAAVSVAREDDAAVDHKPGRRRRSCICYEELLQAMAGGAIKRWALRKASESNQSFICSFLFLMLV